MTFDSEFHPSWLFKNEKNCIFSFSPTFTYSHFIFRILRFYQTASHVQSHRGKQLWKYMSLDWLFFNMYLCGWFCSQYILIDKDVDKFDKHWGFFSMVLSIIKNKNLQVVRSILLLCHKKSDGLWFFFYFSFEMQRNKKKSNLNSHIPF